MKHSRRRDEDFLCPVLEWVADVNHDFPSVCLSCDTPHRINGDRLDSATNLYMEFDTKSDSWVYRGRLSEEDTEVINQDMEAKRELYHKETDRGPNNISYGALGVLLEECTQKWDNFVDDKLEAERQQAKQNRDQELG